MWLWAFQTALEAATAKILFKIHELLLADKRLKVLGIASAVRISDDRIVNFLATI